MLKKSNCLSKLTEAGVIAVIRGKDKTEAIRSASALIEGGILGIEVTYTVPNANEVIQELCHLYETNEKLVIGAGTVLDAATARLAIMSGAAYIVSPAFDEETATLCNLYQVPYLPGCVTMTEIIKALRCGVEVIKLFPATTYPPSFIKDLKGPLPQLNIMPTGGINLDNMNDWLEAGAVAVGVGGSLLAPAATNDFAKMTEMAKLYMEKYHQLKGAKSVG